MSVIKEMNPELAWRLIEQYRDELTPAAEEQEALYRKFHCPRCRISLQKQFDSRTVFDGEAIIAKAQLLCPQCGYLIDPHTGLVVACGDASKTPRPEGEITILGQGK